MSDYPAEWVEKAAEALYVQQFKHRADLIEEGITWANLDGPWRSDMLAEARAVLDAVAPTIRAEALREAADEMDERLDTFPQSGRHTRARWAENWLRLRADREEAQ